MRFPVGAVTAVTRKVTEAIAENPFSDRRLRHGTEQPLQALRMAFINETRVTSAHAVYEPAIAECGVSHRPLLKVPATESRTTVKLTATIGPVPTSDL